MSTGLFGTANPHAPTNGVTTTSAPATSAPAGLFAPAQAAPPPPPPVPVQSDIERQAAIAAARALLAAEDAAAAALPAPPPPTIAMPHIGAINPPDALPATQAQIAAPLSPEVIAKITDPEIKARAEAHAVAAASAPAAAGTKEKTRGRCAATGQKISVTADEVLAARKKWPCPKCGKDMKLKPEKNEDGGFAVTITSHNMASAIAAPDVPAMVVPPPVVLASTALEDTGPNIFITGADGSRRKLTQQEIDATVANTPPPVPVTPVAVTAPLPPPVPQPALPQAKIIKFFTVDHAEELWTVGKYDEANSVSLIIIASRLSNR